MIYKNPHDKLMTVDGQKRYVDLVSKSSVMRKEVASFVHTVGSWYCLHTCTAPWNARSVVTEIRGTDRFVIGIFKNPPWLFDLLRKVTASDYDNLRIQRDVAWDVYGSTEPYQYVEPRLLIIPYTTRVLVAWMTKDEIESIGATWQPEETRAIDLRMPR